MRVCFCVHRLPYPPVGGGKTETYEMIAGLVDRGHDVHVVSYGEDTENAAEMEVEAGCTVTLVPGVPDRTPRNLVRNLVSRDPLPVMKARTDAYQDEVRAAVADADVLHLHALQTSYLASSLDVDVPTVIRFNNVKYVIYRQFARHTQNPAEALYAYLQFLKTRSFETSIPEASDLTLAISPEDRELLERGGDVGDVEVVPPGVDLQQWRPGTERPDDRTITFFGSMDYHPNEEAATWFTDEVFPRVRERFPDVTLELVGKSPPPSVQRLGEREGVLVTGFVDDIREYIDRATVVVLPIRVGTGVRIKALHALAMGKPIVSTPLGVQGIAVEDGRHLSIAEGKQEFASATGSLLSDPERRERYGRNARTLAETDHDWSKIVERLEGHYESVLEGGEPAVRSGRSHRS